MRYPEATKVPGDLTTNNAVTGPLAAPGTYQVQLRVGDQTYTQSFELLKDPRITASQEDLAAQFKLWLEIRDKLSETHEGINRLRRVKEQVATWLRHLKDSSALEGQDNLAAIIEAGQTLEDKLAAIEGELIQTDVKTGSDRLRLPSKLNLKLASLISVVSSADAAPTQQAYDVFEHLSTQIDEQLAQLKTIIETDVPAFNTTLREAEVPAIVV